MALDCISYYMGPAYHNLDGLFVMNFIFITFLLLFTIPIRVQVITICDRLHFYKCFTRWLESVAGRPHQQLTQTLPLFDECTPALKTRPILICHIGESLLLTPLTPQRTLAPQQDRALEEPGIEISSEPSTSIEDRHSISNTPLCQVQSLLGTTPIENTQL